MRFRSSVMEPARVAGLAGRWHAEQSIAPCGQPVVKNWSEFRKRPDRENRHEPFPTRQDENYFNPSEVSLWPTTMWNTRIHLLGLFVVRVWRSSFNNFRIVIVEQFDS